VLAYYDEWRVSINSGAARGLTMQEMRLREGAGGYQIMLYILVIHVYFLLWRVVTAFWTAFLRQGNGGVGVRVAMCLGSRCILRVGVG